eukprot:2330990-Rhodomonas_salina.2
MRSAEQAVERVHGAPSLAGAEGGLKRAQLRRVDGGWARAGRVGGRVERFDDPSQGCAAGVVQRTVPGLRYH